MIDIVTSLTIVSDGHEDEVCFFGRIDEEKREIVLHYELDRTGNVLLQAEDFWKRKLVLSVKSTDARIYSVYGCHLLHQSKFFSSSGMGMLKGVFERLIMQNSPSELYDSISFVFKDIERVFPLLEIRVGNQDQNKLLSLSQDEPKNHFCIVDEGISGTITSHFQGIPSDPCVEIHITQEKTIELSFEQSKTADELLNVLSKAKLYIEFLLSQEIQLTSIRLINKEKHYISQVLADSLFSPYTFIKPIDSTPYRHSVEDFFAGLHGWLANIEKYSRVIDIWKKTIYNTNVSDEDIFIWRCQAFELLCALTDEIKEEAYKVLAPDQSNPNVRNYLSVVSSRYDIARSFSDYYSDVKDVRDKLTHNNPKKTVTEDQIKNAYGLINHFLIATIAMIMGIKCRLPMFILKPKK